MVQNGKSYLSVKTNICSGDISYLKFVDFFLNLGASFCNNKSNLAKYGKIGKTFMGSHACLGKGCRIHPFPSYLHSEDVSTPP